MPWFSNLAPRQQEERMLLKHRQFLWPSPGTRLLVCRWRGLPLNNWSVRSWSVPPRSICSRLAPPVGPRCLPEIWLKYFSSIGDFTMDAAHAYWSLVCISCILSKWDRLGNAFCGITMSCDGDGINTVLFSATAQLQWRLATQAFLRIRLHEKAWSTRLCLSNTYQCTLDILQSFFLLYLTKDTPYGVSFVNANLTEVLSLELLYRVHYRIIYNRDISRAYSMGWKRNHNVGKSFQWWWPTPQEVLRLGSPTQTMISGSYLSPHHRRHDWSVCTRTSASCSLCAFAEKIYFYNFDHGIMHVEGGHELM